MPGPWMVFIADSTMQRLSDSRQRMRRRRSEIYPRRSAMTFDRALDKTHAAQAGLNAGQCRRQRICAFLLPCFERIGKLTIKHGECFDISLRMSGRNAGDRARIGAKVSSRRMANFFRSVLLSYDEAIRVLLQPFERTGFSIDAQAHLIDLSGSHLRAGQRAGCAVGEAQKSIAIVVETAARNDAAQRSVYGRDPEPAYILEQMEGVGADIADRAARSAAHGIGTPLGLPVASGFERAAEPALKIFDGHFANGAEPAGGAQGARLAHHRIAGVSMGKAVGQAGFADDLGEFERLVIRRRRRLVAHYGNARLKCGPGDGQMQMVGRRNNNEIDAVRAPALGFHHPAVVGISPRRVDAETQAGFARTLRRLRKRPGNELNPAIEFGGDAMHGPDEGAGTAAGHAHAQLTRLCHLSPFSGMRHRQEPARPAIRAMYCWPVYRDAPSPGKDSVPPSPVRLRCCWSPST